MKGKAEEMYRVCKQKAQTFLKRSKKKTKVYDTYLPLTFSKLPSGHGSHAELPNSLAKVPATHCLHCEADERPVASAKEPAGHEPVQLVPPAATW